MKALIQFILTNVLKGAASEMGRQLVQRRFALKEKSGCRDDRRRDR